MVFVIRHRRNSDKKKQKLQLADYRMQSDTVGKRHKLEISAKFCTVTLLWLINVVAVAANTLPYQWFLDLVNLAF